MVKIAKIYKIDECLKLTNVTDPVGSSSLVGNSHYRAFVTNANAQCIELGQHVRHCHPKEITPPVPCSLLSGHALELPFSSPYSKFCENT
jgi:hypothetical protein